MRLCAPLRRSGSQLSGGGRFLMEKGREKQYIFNSKAKLLLANQTELYMVLANLVDTWSADDGCDRHDVARSEFGCIV